jgi:hypothetical protein
MVAAVNKTAAKNDTDATSYTTASVNFVANRLYLIGLLCHNSIAGISITASGTITTAAVASTTFNTIASPNKTIKVFRCMPTSNETTTITWNSAGELMSHGFWSIDEFDVVDTSGTAGSGAVVQSATNRADTGSSLTVTLAAFGSANNAAYGFFCRSENENMTPGSGFTQLSEITGVESPTSSILAEWKTNDTTVDCSFATSGVSAGVAVEIKEAVGGGGASVVDPFGMSGFFGG